MLGLIRCQLQGKASGFEFGSSTGGKVFLGVYGARPIGVGLGQRSLPAFTGNQVEHTALAL